MKHLANNNSSKNFVMNCLMYYYLPEIHSLCLPCFVNIKNEKPIILCIICRPSW